MPQHIRHPLHPAPCYLSTHVCRPKGRCHIMVPAGGANAEGWLAFRDVLARIEAYTSRSTPAQVHTSAHMPQHTDMPSYNQISE